MTDRYDHIRLPQDSRGLGELTPLRRHRDLAQSAVRRAEEALDQVRIRVAKKGGIMRTMVVAGQKRALKVDP